MNLRAVQLLLFCSLVFVSGYSQSKKSPSKQLLPLLTINKKTVSTDEFLYLYKKNHQNPKDDYTREKIDEYLLLYTNFKLKVEEARHRGMDTTIAFKREFNQYKDELRKPYLPGSALTDSLTQMTYERMKEEVRASHILISLKPDASPEDTLKAFNRISEIRNRILAGLEFSQAAEEFSEDPSAKSNKGDLGYFTALQMVYPFENAAYSTPVGQISKPLRTRFGYHILKVFDRRQSKGEVEVSHIMIRTGDERSEEQAKNVIFTIYDQLAAGAKWDELCKQNSEDPSTKDMGGKLRPFRSGMLTQVPEFERVAFELEKPGEYSDPFETQYGWHIIRLERKIPLASYEELAPGLRAKVTRDERSEISKAALQARLKSNLGFSENAAIKAQVFGSADSTLQKGTWTPTADKKLSKEKLFVLNGKIFKVSDFTSYVLQNQHPVSISSQKYIEQLYNNFVDETILVVQEQDVKIKYPEYQYLLNEYYEGILLFEIMEKEVWNKASEDSVGQHLYFLAHTADYVAGDRARTTVYSTADGKLLEALAPLVKEENQIAITEYCGKNKIKTESGYFKQEDKAVFKQVKWEKGVQRADVNGISYLVWFKEILPAGKMTFEEARPSVVSDFQTYLENTWLEQLKKKYKVAIDPKGKESIISQLEKK